MTESVDAKVFTLITVGTTAVVGLLKKFFPKLMEGREEGFALLLPIIFTIAAKYAGLFKATEWTDALLFAAGGGLVAGVIHDKAVNPAKKLAKSIFSKKKDTK